MITKEHLEELIKEKATIYYKGGIKKPQFYKWSGYWFTDYSIFHEKLNIWYELKDLFETKEEAEWYLKFGNITRTETLKLPSWEEFKEIRFVEFFYNEYDYMLQYQNISQKIAVYDRNNKGDYFLMEATKENYIEACKLCKKIFLGEEV